MLAHSARAIGQFARATVFLGAMPIVPTLSGMQQRAIAEAFAPTFIFHADEAFYPVSPLFPLTVDSAHSHEFQNGPAVAERLGAGARRIEVYRALSRREKVSAAAVMYRVYPQSINGQWRVVAEYWCHYVFNQYVLRLGWLPFRVRDNHEQDLENVRIILEPSQTSALLDALPSPAWARATFSVSDVIASAHAGPVPANRYTVREGTPVLLPLHVLVERGSHAMAPDIDRDGLFTPGVDGDAGKFVWGIRDHGNLWARYQRRFSDSRAGPDAVQLCAASDADAVDTRTPGCRPYRLESADELDDWYATLELSAQQRATLVGTSRRLGAVFVDRDYDQLILPPRQNPVDSVDRVLRRPAVTERGWLAGFTTTDGEPTGVLGRQQAWLSASSRAPSLLVETSVRIRSGAKPLAEAAVAGTYPIDAITTAVFAFGWLPDSAQPRGARIDGLAALQLRAGHLRVRPGYRLGIHAFDAVVFVVF